jgi:uncharacterized membrane protein
VSQKRQVIEQVLAGLLVVLFSLFIGIVLFALFSPDGRFDFIDFYSQLIFGLIVILFCFIVWNINKWNAYNLILTGVIIIMVTTLFMYYRHESNTMTNINYLCANIWPITAFPEFIAASILLAIKSIRNKSNIFTNI